MLGTRKCRHRHAVLGKIGNIWPCHRHVTNIPSEGDEEYLFPHDENNIINSVNGYILPVGFSHHGLNRYFHWYTEPGDSDGPLPCEKIHDLVVESHCVRPRSNLNRMAAELSAN